jgi:hypothetical protein
MVTEILITEKEQRAGRRFKTAIKRRKAKKLLTITIHKKTKVELKNKRKKLVKITRKEINASISSPEELL